VRFKKFDKLWFVIDVDMAVSRDKLKSVGLLMSPAFLAIQNHQDKQKGQIDN
jgi:hypothetical protein